MGSHAPLISKEKETIIPSDWILEPTNQSLCGGHYAYIPPPAPFSLESFRTLPMTLSANQTEFSFEGTSLLQGNVTLIQGNRYLHADELLVKRSLLDQQWSELIAKGHIELLMPGLRILGGEATYSHTNKELQLNNTEYRWYAKQARGQAETIDVCENGILQLKKANYTTCSPLSDTWLLKAKNITIDPKRGRATAKHIQLNWFDFPVFYMPYFNYPIDNKRHSGFLFPSYTSSKSSGFEFSIPYYWNIGPNYDLTLTERWTSERSSEIQTKFRYLWPFGEGIFQWHFLPYDRKYATFSQQNIASPPPGYTSSSPQILALNTSATRSVIHYHHSSQFAERWLFNVLYNYVSDDNYLLDLGNDINSASTIHLPKKANLTYYGENWTHYFNVEEYQVLEPMNLPTNDEIYKRQPQWLFLAEYPDLLFNLTFAINGEAVNFSHLPDLLTRTVVTTGQRYHLRPSIRLPLENSWYYFKPRYQLDWLSYDLSLGEFSEILDLPSHPTRTIPLYDLDMGLIFERELHYKQYSFSQTLEPRAYYLYVPYRNQNLYPNFDSGIINFSYSQLFRDNRFSGRDRVGDTNQLTLNLTTRFIPHSDGREWLRASVGQILFFAPQRVFLCEEENNSIVCIVSEDPEQILGQFASQSSLIAQADFNPHPQWSGGLFWQVEPTNLQTEQAAVNIQYNPSSQKIINFNYYWQLQDFAQFDPVSMTMGSLHQAEISVFWPLTMRWQMIARWHYNLIQKQTIEVLGGLEYNGCCMSFQLIGLNYLQSGIFSYPNPRNNVVLAQIVLKGLGSIPLSGNPDSKLREKIPGYLPLYDRQQQLSRPRKSFFAPHEISPY